MQFTDNGMCIWFPGLDLGFWSRRILEHVQQGQINPFERLDAESATHPEQFVDVVDNQGCGLRLRGITLFAAQTAGNDDDARLAGIVRQCGHHAVQEWLSKLAGQLLAFTRIRGRRNVPRAFLVSDPLAPFAVKNLRSSLADWLARVAHERMTGAMWIGRLQNLQGKGLRLDELEQSGILAACCEDHGEQFTGAELAKAIKFGHLRLSVRPVTPTAENQLSFTTLPRERWTRLAQARRRKTQNARDVHIDRALGYSIESRQWDDLFGCTQTWAVYTRTGEILSSADAPHGFCTTESQARSLADAHAHAVLPKASARGQWSQHATTGGRQYREWLVTLPWFPESYFSQHFACRNILLHVRCDLREAADGSTVLFIQEVQSDWAQDARRVGSVDLELDSDNTPPWLNEWPALALKLMLLHAAHIGVAGLAWTLAETQVRRWDGLGSHGLRELYGKTLPKEANKLLRPFRRKVETLALFQPSDYAINPAEDGYDVFDLDGQLVATCATWEAATQCIPCGSRETLIDVPGIRIDAPLRSQLERDGLMAWGGGIS